jgi:hypothetical protein
MFQVGVGAVNNAGTLQTLAGTHRLLIALHNLQKHLDQGPALTVIRAGHTVIVDEAESEHHWPSFIPYAIDLGLRSYLGGLGVPG